MIDINTHAAPRSFLAKIKARRSHSARHYHFATRHHISFGRRDSDRARVAASRKEPRIRIRAAIALGLLLWIGGLAYAQPASKKPITIVVPFSPGSGSDILARALTDPLRERLQQVVVVENRVGASGNIGTS